MLDALCDLSKGQSGAAMFGDSSGSSSSGSSTDMPSTRSSNDPTAAAAATTSRLTLYGAADGSLPDFEPSGRAAEMRRSLLGGAGGGGAGVLAASGTPLQPMDFTRVRASRGGGEGDGVRGRWVGEGCEGGLGSLHARPCVHTHTHAPPPQVDQPGLQLLGHLAGDPSDPSPSSDSGDDSGPTTRSSSASASAAPDPDAPDPGFLDSVSAMMAAALNPDEYAAALDGGLQVGAAAVWGCCCCCVCVCVCVCVFVCVCVCVRDGGCVVGRGGHVGWGGVGWSGANPLTAHHHTRTRTDRWGPPLPCSSTSPPRFPAWAPQINTHTRPPPAPPPHMPPPSSAPLCTPPPRTWWTRRTRRLRLWAPPPARPR